MNRFRHLHLGSLLLACALAGCQTLAPLAAGVRSERAIAVTLTPPADKALLALVERKQRILLDHYTATLLEWDGDSFEPTAHTVTSTVVNKATFQFDHLDAKRYQVKAVGYDKDDMPLTAEALSEEIDLTGNDLALSHTVNLAMTMLPTEFSGKLLLPTNADDPNTLPAWATSVSAVVKKGGDTVATVAYLPTQRASVKNLAPGVSYTVEVTASDGAGQTITKSYTYRADATKGALEDTLDRPFFDRAFPTGGGPVDIDMGADGNAWTLNQNANTVTRISPTGATSHYTVGTIPYGMPIPGGAYKGIAVDAGGNAWVANAGSNTVTRVSATGGIATYTVGSRPFAIDVDTSGNTWVACHLSATVTRISSTNAISTYSVGSAPLALKVDEDGNAWVANSGSGTVTRISASGAKSTYTVGTTPNAVAVDTSGNTWVTNYGSDNVTRISVTGEISTYTVGTKPSAVAVDAGGNTWVTNSASKDVTRISATGAISTHSAGTMPSYIAVDASGHAWVSNMSSANVTRISPTGALTTYTVGSFPRAVVMDAGGNAWVATTGPNYAIRLTP